MPNMQRFFGGGGQSPFGQGDPKGRTFDFGQSGDAPQEFKQKGAGSGVIVRSDGWILTNDHVVQGADTVKVLLHDGRTLNGTVRRDPKSDLAMVKVDATGLQAVEFADSDKTRVGQWAIAFGSPFELNDTMTVGVVSARQRQKIISENGMTRFYPSLLQTDASINPGNSGGALVDSKGQLMGINVAINSPNGGNVGIGFAIPSNTAKDVMEQLITTGKVVRGFLGLTPVALTPEMKKQYGVTAGALVRDLNEDTPAGRAGIQPEDVIVKFDGKPVEDEIGFRSMVARVKPGTKVDVVVHRNGRDQTLVAAIGEAPSDPNKPVDQPAPEAKTGGKLGVQLEQLTPELLKQFKLPSSATGAVVKAVAPGSVASEIGIQAGDVISRIDGKQISSPSDLKDAMAGIGSGQNVRLVVQREKQRMLVTVTIP